MMFPKQQKIYNGFFRGIVLDNEDPQVKGRCKIFVPGVYPDIYSSEASSLPFAEPAMPLFGGSFTRQQEDGQEDETGVTSPPHIGANLWVFFEAGDHNNPVYAFSIQGGEGWASEHSNQHVIKTDNVRIRIDEDFDNPDSTSKFDSFNRNNTYLSEPNKKDKIPTRLDIEVTGPTNIILNSNLDKTESEPAFNIQINGTVFSEINGDKHETITGNWYIKHVGDLHHVHTGNSILEQVGNRTDRIAGNVLTSIDENNDLFVNGSMTKIITKSENITVGVTQTQNITQRTLIVNGTNNVIVNGIQSILVTGLNSENYTIGSTISSTGAIAITSVLGTAIVAQAGEVVIQGTIIRLN